MKKLRLITALIACSLTASAQQWSETGNNHTTGNLGLGTSTPSKDIQILRSNSLSGIEVVNTDITGRSTILTGEANSGGKYIYLGYQNASYNSSNGAFQPASGILFTGAPSGMRFISSNYISMFSGGLGSSNERLRITNTGSIGIGTTSPSNKVDIEQDINGTVAIEVTNTNTGNQARRGIYVGNGTSGNMAYLLSTSSNYDGIPSWQSSGVLGPDSQLSNGLVLRSASGGIRFQPSSTSDKIVFDSNGNVGIGITNPTQKLQVVGTVYSTEVKVELAAGQGPDYVFEPEYELRTLKETKEYIFENKHLPEIPSAKEMETNGVDLGDMNMRLLKKIEELTLYQIELLERLEKAEQEISQLKNK